MSRLPQVGGDTGDWGDILNDYLSQSHNADGTLRTDTVGAAQLRPNSVTSTALLDGAVTGAKLADGAVTPAKLTALGEANGVASLGSDGRVPDGQMPTRLSDTTLAATYASSAQGAKADAAIPAAEKGAASGVATLDVNSSIPATEIPMQAIADSSELQSMFVSAAVAADGSVTLLLNGVEL